jgi:hypothetical protein
MRTAPNHAYIYTCLMMRFAPLQPSPQALPTYVGSLAFVSGFLIRFDDMPVYWRWYSRGNPLAYSFTASESAWAAACGAPDQLPSAFTHSPTLRRSNPSNAQLTRPPATQ